jgi:tetratricopeptide (TPR) repeat protein
MKRLLLTALVLGLGTVPAWALDVKFKDKAGKVVEVTNAEVDEGPDGLTIKKGIVKTGRVSFPVKVSPADVVDYQPRAQDIGTLDYASAFRPPLAKVEIGELKPKEEDRLRDFDEAVRGSDKPDGLKLTFDKLLPTMKDSAAKRHVAFRQAQTLYRLAQADEKFVDKDKVPYREKYREAALAALARYHNKENAGGWQISLALQMLAQLQGDQGDLEGQRKTYEALAEVPGLSLELKVTSLLSSAGVLMKTEKFGEARAKLQGVLGLLPADSPQRSKVQVYLTQCQILSGSEAEAKQAEGQLRTLLNATDDKALRALAHNTLGDYYTKLKRDEDAFWEYLRVDTLYPDDRDEHARAMYHLHRLFRDGEKVRNSERAEAYLETLTKSPRYAGTEYAKRATKKE